MRILFSVGLNATFIRADRVPRLLKEGKDGTHEQNEN